MYQILCVPQAEKQSFPSTNLDRLGKTGGYLQLRSFTFLPAQSLFSSSCRCCRRWQLETSCPKLIILARSLLRTILDPASWWLRFLHSRLSCEDPCWNDPNWGDNLLGGSSQNDPNCEHSLEEKEGHLALATSTVATLRVARLGFPTQAISKLSRHGGWRRTWQMWHWPWNVKSTVRKARPSPTQAWIAWARVVATYNLAASLFCTAQSLSRTILDPASSPKVVLFAQLHLL